MKLGNLKVLLEARANYTGKKGFYCCMPVKDADAILNKIEEVGLTCNVDELHVTIMYSPTKTPGHPSIPITGDLTAKVIGYDMFGPEHDTLVLKLECPKLNELHDMYKTLGAEPTYSTYRPHMTIFEKIELTDDVKQKVEQLIKDMPTITLHKIRFEDIVND